ncbi:MAG: IS4 family transposase [Pseudomonadota bacterium]
MSFWRQLVEQARESLPPDLRLWHGLRLLATDCTWLVLPEAFWPHFGSHGGSRGQGPALVQAIVLYELASRCPIAFRLGSAQPDDRALLLRLLGQVHADDLLLVDNGFYSIEVLARILRRGAHFLIPTRSNAKPTLLERLGPDDGLYQIRASDYWNDHPDVPSQMTVRMVVCHRDGFRPRTLVTSLLDPERFPAADLAELYHRRWHIETFFRDLKHTLHVTHWHARTLKPLYAELIFAMTLASLTRLLMAQAAAQAHVSPASLSFGKSLPCVVRALALAGSPFSPGWEQLHRELMECLAFCKLDQRPGRSFERDAQKRRTASRAKRRLPLAPNPQKPLS